MNGPSNSGEDFVVEDDDELFVDLDGIYGSVMPFCLLPFSICFIPRPIG
jgi:hypothetical protein